VVADSLLAICGGGVAVPKYTSYVTVSSGSGSPPVQLRTELSGTSIASSAGFGLFGS